MCGIIGYIGDKDAVPVIIDGLRHMEYRGYDSTGIAVVDEGQQLWVQKKEGKLGHLEEKLNGYPDAGIGIGHTRWATHGAPSDDNAHPHTDCQGNIAIVHNGIIENYAPLRRRLEQEGHIFRSETDTEVFAHLVEHYYNGSLEGAVRRALQDVKGSYAVAAVATAEPDKIVAVRNHSPLMVGMGEDQYYLTSDVPAILNRTRNVYFLEDGEMAVLTRDGVVFSNGEGQQIEKSLYHVTWDPMAAEKGGLPHFMIKEILEQPQALRETLRGRIKDNRVDFSEVDLDSFVDGVEKVFITACGTAYHAGMVGKYLIEKFAHIPVEIDIASEFRYREILWGENSILVVISQSGETADTLAAIREAKRQGIKILAITNVVGSSVAREADKVLYTWAGPEIAVASTKAYSTQLLLMYLLAIYLAQHNKSLPAGEIDALVGDLSRIADLVETTLKNAVGVQGVAEKYHDAGCIFFIGRGLDYAVALEGSLKLKEISYIHAEAYAAGEMKHGTLALVEEGVPIVALATQDELEEKMLSNIREVKARGAVIIGIGKDGMVELEHEADELITIPACDSRLAPILTVIPLQLLAYYTAVQRGCDVDKPRNLAKSVTVE
ncbi:MAG: glutamine--fructose-6-phosphate transaminase (isomerizing) [Syntrophomonadaceae bacterium]|nr:glutamine--fructose-6-phosphate transaminase (isomerizing) [Syntrophomonadaceae bacterium]